MYPSSILSILFASALDSLALLEILTVVVFAIGITAIAKANPDNSINVLELTKFAFALLPF